MKCTSVWLEGTDKKMCLISQTVMPPFTETLLLKEGKTFSWKYAVFHYKSVFCNGVDNSDGDQ